MNATVMTAAAPRVTPFELFFPDQARRDDCRAALARLLERAGGAYASVLATVDGQPVAQVATEEGRPARVAAIIGSLCALGETLSKEINQHTCRNVLIETDAGFSVVQRLSAPADRLILMTASNRETNLGVLLTHSRTCAAAIARLALAPGK